MRKSFTSVSAAAIVLALATPLLAGGFFIVLGNADASSEARALKAVLTVQAAGCHDAEKAAVTGTAIGLVNGTRQSIPLKLAALPGKPGMYAVTQQWPSEGKWVLQFVGVDQDRVTTTLVAAGPDGIERQTAKYTPGQPSPAAVAEFLKAATSPAVAHK
jgi:hypothetical protein